MKIIDNKKDYYDFYAGIYGIDEKVVYDRRGSVRYSDFLKSVSCSSGDVRKVFESNINKIIVRIGFNIYEFEKEPILGEELSPVQQILTGSKHDRYNGDKWIMPETITEVLGWRKYNYHPNPRLVDRKFIEEEFKKREKEFKNRTFYNEYEKSQFPPVEIRMLQDNNISYVLDDYEFYRTNDRTVYNPILQDYPVVASFISPDIVWQNIYDFITTMSEKEIIDTRTDTLKLESAGFDKKTSFRNIK